MIYNLKTPLEFCTDDGKTFNVVKIQFEPLKARHLINQNESLQGIIEDFYFQNKTDDIVKETLAELSSQYSTENHKLQELILEVCKKHQNGSFFTKAKFYNKIDIAIANIYFKPVNNSNPLAKGITSDGDGMYLSFEKEYQDISEEDIIGIRELLKKKYTPNEAGVE